MSEHEELENSVAAWVLGALAADESESLRIHVESCPSCREAATRLARAVGALPLAVEEVTPPARLRERILAAAAASRASAAPLPLLRAKDHRRPPRPKPLTRDLRSRMPAYAAAAAVLLALLVGLAAGDLLGRGAPAPNPVARFTLVGHQELATARATVIDLKGDGVALVDFNGLPALDSGRVYEVWLITAGGRADPAAVFVPDSSGSKVVLVNRSLSGYTEMAITNEAGPDGSTAPSQQPQMSGTLA